MTGSKRIKLKICLLGDPAVGKTSLVQKYIYNFFSDSYMRTLGTKVSRKVVNYHEPKHDVNYEITMMIWDIMGQKFTNLSMTKYLKMSQGALIVFDSTRRETFESLKDWKNTMYNEVGVIPIIYLANKIDLTNDIDVTKSEFEEFSKQEQVFSFLTSAKTGENVNEAFFKLGELIISSLFGESTDNVGVSTEDGKQLLEPISDFIAQTVKPRASSTGYGLGNNNHITSQSKMIDVDDIQPGLGYIIKEEKPNQSFRVFKELRQHGLPGLCISRMHPQRIKHEYQIEDVPIYWLSSDAPNKEMVVTPTFLPQLNTIIINSIQKDDNAVILFEGIEYLIEQNDFKAVLNLIHSMNDHIMGSNARVIIPIDPLILKEREMHMLSRDLKIL